MENNGDLKQQSTRGAITIIIGIAVAIALILVFFKFVIPTGTDIGNKQWENISTCNNK